jgi:outer membrane protein OmpA-like peptidoglycan-associated protein
MVEKIADQSGSTSRRRLLVAAVAVTMTAGVAGCGSATPPVTPSGAASFVIGARSNMPAPRLDGETMGVLNSAVDNQSYASIVVADGRPSVIGEKDLIIEGANDVARAQSKQHNRHMVEDGIVGAKAGDKEVDLLAALELAARTVRSKATTPSSVVVVDSGLSTTGALDFTRPGMLSADPPDVVESLKSQDALPDLGGIEVVWQGMGDTAPPQQSPSNGQRKNLEAIWAAVLVASGGKPRFEEHPLTKAEAVGLPWVTPVNLPASPKCTTTTLTLSSSDVAFKPDSAEFFDSAAARSVLSPIAKQLASSDGVRVTLTGTTANVGDFDGQKSLSQDRAGAVLQVLAELGVPRSSMTAVGLGSHFSGYVPDHNPDGSLNPGAAAQNRKVIVTTSRTNVLNCS